MSFELIKSRSRQKIYYATRVKNYHIVDSIISYSIIYNNTTFGFN